MERRVSSTTKLDDVFYDTICYLRHGKRVYLSALSSAFTLLNSFLNKCEALELGAVEMIDCRRGFALRFILTPNKPQQFYYEIRYLVSLYAKKAKLTF